MSDIDDHTSSNVLGRADMRQSFTTLTYITDDETSLENVNPEAFEIQDKSTTHPEAVTQETEPAVIGSTVLEDQLTSTHLNGLNHPTDNTVEPTTDDHPNSERVNSSGVLYDHQLKSTNPTGDPIPQIVFTNGHTAFENDSHNTVESTRGGGGHANTNPSRQIVFTNGQTTFENDVAINSYQNSYRYDSSQSPLTQKRIRLLKGLAIAAAIFFFPAGIPACVYAFRINKAFQDGIMQGNIDLALKLAKRTEKCVILSAVLGVLTIVMLFSIIERLVFGKDYYWHSGTIVGHR